MQQKPTDFVDRCSTFATQEACLEELNQRRWPNSFNFPAAKTIKLTFWPVFSFINAANVIFKLRSPPARTVIILDQSCPSETVNALPKF